MSQLTIVTGGAGIIGSHLVERLARSAQTVLVIERPGTDVDHLLAEVEVVFADIRDRNASATALKGGALDLPFGSLSERTGIPIPR